MAGSYRDEPLPAFPLRDQAAHKGSVGRVLVVAGSPGMTGAAYLAGTAALRTGSGLVTIACPAAVHEILEIKTTCVMTRALPDRDGVLGPWSRERLEELVAGVDAVAVGPGLGGASATRFLLRSWIPTLKKPHVIDADGLNALVGFEAVQRSLSSEAVLTPHPGELGRLLGVSARAVQADRGEALRSMTGRLSSVVLLKGQGTLIGQGTRVAINNNGNPGMATGGSGDVLTGVIASLLGAGLSPFESAQLGAFLHGHAGDLAAEKSAQASLIASDILAELGSAIRACEQHAQSLGDR